MTRQIRAAQRDREELLVRAADASDEERRRLAGALHDGVVQDLAGASFVIAGAIDQVEPAARRTKAGNEALTGFRQALVAIRESIGGLRSLLVEIYPPTLRSAGLASTLSDLVAPLSGRGITVQRDISPTVRIPADAEALIFRVAQEALRNVVKHAKAQTVALSLRQDDRKVEFTVADDGVGYDTSVLARKATTGHFGLNVAADLAHNAGARLEVASRPGGSWLRLVVPLS
jgi:signal transduction histidine kinase